MSFQDSSDALPPLLSIRPAREGDLAAMTDLTNHFIRETPIHFADEEETQESLKTAWEARGPYPWLVVESGGAFAGYAKAGVWRSRAAYAWTAETAIYVCQAARRQGIGRALYAALLETLRESGFHSAVAGITLPNEASVKLHEGLGFVSAGVVREAGFKFERWWDVGFWQKIL